MGRFIFEVMRLLGGSPEADVLVVVKVNNGGTHKGHVFLFLHGNNMVKSPKISLIQQPTTA